MTDTETETDTNTGTGTCKTYFYFDNSNFPIQVTPKTHQVTPATFPRNGCMWEREAIKMFYSFIDPNHDNIIVDIGAQTGLYSLMGKYLPNSTIYAFEPFPDSVQVLHDNLRLNHITNVIVRDCALSDTQGSTSLNTCISHNGLHTMGCTPMRFNDINPIHVLADTVDNQFYHKHIPVTMIKMDTEGWEYRILKGAEQTIRQYQPIIQLEWNVTNMAQCGITEHMLSSLLESYGYMQTCQEDEERMYVHRSKHCEKDKWWLREGGIIRSDAQT